MLFNSLTFLYVFLPITSLVFWRLTGKTWRYVWLTTTGYVFYSFWDYRFCSLMLFSTSISYMAGLGLLRWRDPLRRRLCVAVPVAMDLALLGFFKYANFMVANINGITSWLGGRPSLPILDIVLPIGISFYTFHTITYVIDAYRGVVTPTRNFFKFASYVSLFSQLVAGPIVRYRQIEQDFEKIERPQLAANLETGWSFFVIGMVEKVLIADTIAAVIDPALARYAELSTVSAWLSTVGFTYQIYFDFAGYSDMAIGLGYLFGFRLPQNFNSPFKALDIGEFWRRWHISLSSFFRDYVYITLGGSRGSRLATARNLLITMLLCGLWHGASWTFVMFGAYHGLLLVLHRMGKGLWERLPLAARRIGTFGLCVLGFTIFRSSSFLMARTLLATMFAWRDGVGIIGGSVLIVMLALSTVLTHWSPNTFELPHKWSPSWVVSFASLFVLCLFALYGAGSAPYIYFQF